VLAHWNNSPPIDMPPHSDTLSWFRVNQSLHFFLNHAYLAKKQQEQLYSLWFDQIGTRTHDLLHSRRTHWPLHHREPQSTTLDANTLIITPSRTHNLPHPRRTHSSLHHREPPIYHTRGEHTHHYAIENPQSTTLEETTLIITQWRTHNLPHSRRIHSSLHHREPTIYYTRWEHTHHYTIENPQSTTLEEKTLITPSRTHNLPHSRRTHSSLHHREPTIYYTLGEHTHHYTIDNPQSTTL
jgi:hypothetical protein